MKKLIHIIVLSLLVCSCTYVAEESVVYKPTDGNIVSSNTQLDNMDVKIRIHDLESSEFEIPLLLHIFKSTTDPYCIDLNFTSVKHPLDGILIHSYSIKDVSSNREIIFHPTDINTLPKQLSLIRGQNSIGNVNYWPKDKWFEENTFDFPYYDGQEIIVFLDITFLSDKPFRKKITSRFKAVKTEYKKVMSWKEAYEGYLTSLQ